MGAVGVRVLGPVEVVAEAGPIRLAAMQTRLLAALVIGGGSARSLDELVEAVWVGSAPQSARKLVQVYVSQLRKVLPSEVAIQTVDRGYAAQLASGALDAERFERLLRECGEARHAGNPALAVSLVEQALGLWHGRAYGELAYEDFARGESERLEELRLDAIEERFAATLELGRAAAVLGDVLAHAEANVLRERSHELAMLALYRVGRQAEALEHYAAFRARLDEELGLEPGPTLRALQRRILQQDLELDVTVDVQATSALPVPPNPLVGRESEVAALHALLERRESRLVVLTGAGGSGKTRLALEVARQVVGSYANGVVLVELAPLRDPALVMPTIAQALEVSIEGDANVLEAVADALAARELLLVVDNAEHVREVAPAYAELVSRAPRLTLLVTSRAVLHVSGESVVPVVPLAEDDAVELFVQRARLLDPGFELTSENEPDVREICRRVDGLPLAVELAAARIRTLTPRALLERLVNRLTILTRGPRDLPARQQTLRETLDWSVNLLEERERYVLARLAVFVGGATLEAAEAVCDADLDTLGALVDDNLARRVDVNSEPRFGLLETIREYAYELLGSERSEFEVAHAAFFLRLVEAAELRGPAAARSMSLLDSEIDNVRAALDVAVANRDARTELRLVGVLWRYWWVRGYLVEGRGRIEAALGRGSDVEASLYSRVLYGAGILAWCVGDYARGHAVATQLLAAADTSGSLSDEHGAYKLLSMIALRERDFAASESYARRTVELAQQLGDEIDVLVAEANLAVVILDSGQIEASVPMFEGVLGRYRRHGNAEGVGLALLNLGEAAYLLGEYPRASDCFDEARTAFSSIGFRAHVGHALRGLAGCAARLGRYDDAAQLLGQADAQLDEVGASNDDFVPGLADEVEAESRAGLGDDVFDAAYAAGRVGD